MRVRILLCVLLTLLMVDLAAQDGLADWYSRSSLAGKYVSIHQDLLSILSEAGKVDIPSELMMARLAEGAEKRVAPDKLVIALRKDLAIYGQVLSILSRSPLGGVASREREELLILGGLAFRSGMDAATFEAAFMAAVDRKVKPRRAMAAIVAVAAAGSRLPLESEGEKRLAVSMAQSAEKEERFALLSSLFLRGKAGKMGTPELVELAVSIFSSGGGFLQLENEITRRMK